MALLGKMKYDRKEKVQVKFAVVSYFFDLRIQMPMPLINYRFTRQYIYNLVDFIFLKKLLMGQKNRTTLYPSGYKAWAIFLHIVFFKYPEFCN